MKCWSELCFNTETFAKVFKRHNGLEFWHRPSSKFADVVDKTICFKADDFAVAKPSWGWVLSETDQIGIIIRGQVTDSMEVYAATSSGCGLEMTWVDNFVMLENGFILGHLLCKTGYRLSQQLDWKTEDAEEIKGNTF